MVRANDGAGHPPRGSMLSVQDVLSPVAPTVQALHAPWSEDDEQALPEGGTIHDEAVAWLSSTACFRSACSSWASTAVSVVG